MVCLIFSSEGKAQVASEYLVVVGVALVAIAIVAGYSFLMYTQSLSSGQANEAMKQLSKTINDVYSLGPGNSIAVDITLPDTVVSFTASGRGLYLTTNSFGPNSTDTVEVDANVSGTLPTGPGTHTIVVSNSNGAVVLGES